MRAAITGLLGVVMVSGCSDIGAPQYDAGPASVTLNISSSEVMTSAGDTRTITAVVKDARQSVITPPDLTWSSSAPGVASVSPAGTSATITAFDDGDAIITATSGGVQGTLTVSVRRRIVTVGVGGALSVLTVGLPTQLIALALDARQNVIHSVTDFTFSSSNSDVVAITPTGLALGLPDFFEQTATITASVIRSGTTYSGSLPLSVGPPASFDRLAVAVTANVFPNRVPTLALGVAFFSTVETGLAYTFTWSKLTGPALEAHIHGPAMEGELGDVLVDLGALNQTTSFGSISGLITAADIRSQAGQPPISMDSLSALMSTRNAYIDVHTSTYPDGEIRGQIERPFVR
jgi:hypothetical protein